MGRNVIWLERARAELRDIDQITALRILYALADYAATGNGDVQSMQGVEPPEFRLRVGDYRVRFRKSAGEIFVTAVRHRREAYR